MHLYEIKPSDHYPVHVVAHTEDQAVELFLTWSLSCGRDPERFSVNTLPVSKLRPEQQEQVRRAFAAGLVGIAHFDEEIGWTFSPPLWQPLGPDEQPSSGTNGASA